jgi:hypothetical protein
VGWEGPLGSAGYGGARDWGARAGGECGLTGGRDSSDELGPIPAVI